MTFDVEQLDEAIIGVVPSAERDEDVWEAMVAGWPVLIIADTDADRMRIIVPICDTTELTGERCFRLLQANFDSTLDARYCIAQGKLWSAFIHSLSVLNTEIFEDALTQTVTLAATYGTTYNSGELMFSGGDSEDIHLELFQRVMTAEEGEA